MKISFGIVALPLLVLCFSVQSIFAKEKLEDELKKALELPSREAGNRIYKLCVTNVVTIDKDSLALVNTILITKAVSTSSLPNKLAISYEVQANCAKRFMEFQKAKSFIQIALKQPAVPRNQMERLLILLAYVETDLENYLGAIESYSMVEASFQKAKNSFMLARNYISMADLYTKCGLYYESINYLNKAKKEANRDSKNDLSIIFYENMATNYFYLQMIDSLDHYCNLLLASKSKTVDYNIPIYKLQSMSMLLEGDPMSIDKLKNLINNPKDTDRLKPGHNNQQKPCICERMIETDSVVFATNVTIKDQLNRSILLFHCAAIETGIASVSDENGENEREKAIFDIRCVSSTTHSIELSYDFKYFTDIMQSQADFFNVLKDGKKHFFEFTLEERKVKSILNLDIE